MNKTLKLFLMFTLVLFLALIFINTNVYAAEPVTLTQEDFDAAKENAGVDTGKMQYVADRGFAYYFMNGTNYKLNDNIDIGAASIAFYSDIEGKDITLDLANYTIENGTSEEYNNASIWDERSVIIFQNTNATITGTGTIKSNVESYYNALTILEYDEEGSAKTKNQAISNINVQGGISISNTKATVNNVKMINGTLSSTNSDITISGGNYKNLSSTGAASFNESNVTINSGTFTADIASAMYFFSDENNNTLTINNGTFTSAKDNGIEIGGGIINISGGTFKGAMSGITTSACKKITISGGTFIYTDTKEGRGAISMYDIELNDAIATIDENKVLSAGEFKKVEKEDEGYIAINAQSVTVKNKDDNTTTGDTTTGDTTTGDTTTGNTETEDTIIEISSTSSEISNVEANIKFTTPILKGNRLQITKQNDDKVSKELKTKEPNLKAVFDINIISDSGEIIKIENNKMTIKIQLEESLLGYDNYEVVYIKDGEVEERIDATVKDGYIIFETSHLSEYGVIASNNDNKILGEQTTTNPKTGDNIIMYAILSIISIMAIVLTTIIIRKNVLTKKA